MDSTVDIYLERADSELILAKHHFKDDIKISSDGDMDQWEDALNLIERGLYIPKQKFRMED
ncbi:MAG: hypothetical protein ABIJ21_04920 [Nanoarchaeota archaeon]